MQKIQILKYLSDIKDELMNSGIEKIGLFGSFATNKANDFSDIDIAIKINKNYLNEHDVWEYFNLIENIKHGLLKKFSRKVDVFDLDSNADIKNKILKEVIYV
jgi:predicted nucleotidyltransferase